MCVCVGGGGGAYLKNRKVLKRNFQHSQADGCVKKVPKIDYLLLNLAKKSVAISYTFKIDNYCHIPFIKCLQNTILVFLRRTKKSQ